MIKSGERKDAKVARPVPLYWVYVTAWATPDGVTQFREDIYNRDGLGPVAATTSAAKPSFSALRTAGATLVPNSSIERISLACGMVPTLICIR